MADVTITNDSAGKTLGAWWLVPIAPVFLVGFFFFVLAGLTMMTVATSIVDGFPAWYAGPVPVGVDQAFIRGVLGFDHWLVGFVGLSSPWWVIPPGVAASAVWDWATTY
jgi:hypothetical protein